MKILISLVSTVLSMVTIGLHYPPLSDAYNTVLLYSGTGGVIGLLRFDYKHIQPDMISRALSDELQYIDSSSTLLFVENYP